MLARTRLNCKDSPVERSPDVKSRTENDAQFTSLNREITSFVSYISPTHKEHATRTHIVELIRRAVVNQWKDAQVVPFGSFETGLYLPNGSVAFCFGFCGQVTNRLVFLCARPLRRDIDLVISSSTMDRQNKVTVLHTLASVLRRANLAENIQVIAKAKVPIVKFISSYGKSPSDPLLQS